MCGLRHFVGLILKKLKYKFHTNKMLKLSQRNDAKTQFLTIVDLDMFFALTPSIIVNVSPLKSSNSIQVKPNSITVKETKFLTGKNLDNNAKVCHMKRISFKKP